MDKFIGKRLDGRYEFKELIGIGGMANVYKAYDILEQKYVAVKILKEEYLENEDFVRQFRNESKAISSMSHPNIVRIYDVNFGDRIQYIVMEYIDGITLKEYIEKKKVLNWKDVIYFTVQILRALQHAHDKGIVHRDIKPQNMMLLQDGTIKVMDFGIARFARDEKQSKNKAVGSVHYISPEQAAGSVTDAKSDLYSVGIMMYEMLTGKLPFIGNTPEEVAVKQIQNVAVAPRKINPNIPEGLEEIIIRAMQKRASKRYQSAAEMLRDIDEFKKNPDIVFEYKYFTDDGNTKYFDTPTTNTVKEKEKKAVTNSKSSKKPKKATKKLIPILLGVASAVVLVTILIIVLLLNLQSKPAVDVNLVDFTGMTLTEVQAKSEYKDIKWDVNYEFNNQYDNGVIFSQDPQGGITIKSNSKVKLYVSKGAQQLTVPDVKNMLLQSAVNKLKETGFVNIKQVEEDNKDVTANYVIRTDPASGNTVGAKAAITVYYSSGKGATVNVPNVIGKTQQEGTSALQALGLSVQVKTADSDKNKGIIIDQSSTGTVEAGSTITITVSTGNSPKQTATAKISLPSATGRYKFIVTCGGVEISTSIVNFDTSPSSFSFKDTGSAEVKNYVIMVYNEDGSNGQQFATLTINYNNTPPTQSITSQNNNVFNSSSSSASS